MSYSDDSGFHSHDGGTPHSHDGSEPHDHSHEEAELASSKRTNSKTNLDLRCKKTSKQHQNGKARIVKPCRTIFDRNGNSRQNSWSTNR